LVNKNPDIGPGFIYKSQVPIIAFLTHVKIPKQIFHDTLVQLDALLYLEWAPQVHCIVDVISEHALGKAVHVNPLLGDFGAGINQLSCSHFLSQKNMAQIKGAIDTVSTIYRVGRGVGGVLNTASAIGTIANILGIG
jgi:hypothetical protein